MRENKKARRLRLWKIRQAIEGHDVSKVNTLEEAEHFFDKPSLEGTTEEPVPENLEAMSYQDLKAMAKQMGLATNGKKEELIERIRQEQEE